MPLSDDDLLRLVAEERRASIGFETDESLNEARARALDYFKGEMPDVPSLANRSRAVSTDVADAVETLLPDLVEIFTGGDDVATFSPVGQEDEAAARQESDYVNQVVMHDNDGFMTLYAAFKDALLVKTGVIKWWWEEDAASPAPERFQDKSFEELQGAMAAVQAWPGLSLAGVNERIDPETGEALYDFEIARAGRGGRVRVRAVPPEDFTVARDTVRLAETTYCAMRSRPRAQDLIALGYDADKVADLPAYGAGSAGERERLARDTAGEEMGLAACGPVGAARSELRTVEIVEHVLRVVDADGRPELWRVVSGDQERVLLERERVDEVQFAALTPYPQAHRFYGRSVADLLIEIQRIKTALTRMLLDSGYFALNQRVEVATDRASPFTIPDLLRNEPGVPIRSRTGDAVRAIGAGGLSFDAAGALEYFSTVGEARTGIVRNAQGLNPDTLHQTASGAMALMNNAQRRMRMIARIFAETGVKDLFLGVHALIRRHAERAEVVRLRGAWVQVDPTTWGERKDMSIEVGVGSGGREHELAVGREAMSVMTQIIGLQGGLNGPFVTAANAYNFLKRYFERGLGMKTADPILSDPSTALPGPAQAPPPPDPRMVEAQGRQETAKYKADLDAQLERERMAMDAQLKREQIALDVQTRALHGFARPVRVGGQVG